jgi:hypothetical protein
MTHFDLVGAHHVRSNQASSYAIRREDIVSNQSEVAKEQQSPDDADNVDEMRIILADVRKAAGWRVSPRHLDVAMVALDEVGEDPTTERIAAIVTAFHGEGSKRQKRNADLWRMLGAQLAVRGKPAAPDAQLAFIGRAKALSEEDASDSDLLLVATALGSANHPLTPEMTADATTWIIDTLGPDFDPEALEDRLDQAVEAAMAARAERANRRRKGQL